MWYDYLILHHMSTTSLPVFSVFGKASVGPCYQQWIPLCIGSSQDCIRRSIKQNFLYRKRRIWTIINNYFFVPQIIPEFQRTNKKEKDAYLYLLITHIYVQVCIDVVRKLNIWFNVRAYSNVAEIRRYLARIKNFKYYKVLFYFYRFVQYNAKNSAVLQ